MRRPSAPASQRRAIFRRGDDQRAKGARGRVSFGVKRHASNEPNNPYERVLPRSGPDGPSDTFEGGIKLGF